MISTEPDDRLLTRAAQKSFRAVISHYRKLRDSPLDIVVDRGGLSLFSHRLFTPVTSDSFSSFIDLRKSACCPLLFSNRKENFVATKRCIKLLLNFRSP
jgi:hypothetical protein